MLRLNIYFILSILNLNLQSMSILKLTLLFLNSFLLWSLVKIWFENHRIYTKLTFIFMSSSVVSYFMTKTGIQTKTISTTGLPIKSWILINEQHCWQITSYQYVKIFKSKFEKENKVRKIRSVFKKTWTSAHQYASVYELFISQWFTKLSKV